MNAGSGGASCEPKCGVSDRRHATPTRLDLHVTANPRLTSAQPAGATAVLVLGDGSVFWGRGAGATGSKVGEVCFNTSMTGYQEVMTDPSYAGQIITFTFPHVGNVGANPEDLEATTVAARGCILRDDITQP